MARTVNLKYRVVGKKFLALLSTRQASHKNGSAEYFTPFGVCRRGDFLALIEHPKHSALIGTEFFRMMHLAQEFWMLSHSQLVSLSGVALYVGSFAAVQLGRMSGDSIAFACVNVVAAILLLVGIYEAFNLATFLIQVCFATVGGIGISRRLKSRISKSRKLRI